MPRTRKTGDGGLYFDKKKKLWIGVVDNGFTADGKRIQIRRTSKSQSVARRKLEELKAELKSHDTPLGSQTVAEWGVFWLDGYKHKKPQTFRTYSSLLTKWVYPTIGRKKVKEVRASDLRRIYDAMRDAGKSTSTALKVHTMLSSMFESARLDRQAPSNVAKDIRPPKAARSERDTFTPEETLRLLQAAERLPDGTKWIVSLYAGIRQGERLGATIDSFSGNTFTVQWNMVEGNYEHGCDGACGRKHPGHCPEKRLLIPEGIRVKRLRERYLLVPPKSGESRQFPVLPNLALMLERHITNLALRPNPYGLLWPDAEGNPISPRADQAEWKALLAAAEVERGDKVTTHWARHTAISDLTAAGVPERVTGEIVGHKSPGVTGRYQHVASQDSTEAMGRLEDRRKTNMVAGAGD